MTTIEKQTLADILTAKEMTQAEFARKLRVGEAQASRWVRGKNKPNRLYRREIARVLGVGQAEIEWNGRR